MSEIERTGGCLCGAVRYRAAGAPKRVSLCHCETCRKHTGAPFGAFVAYDGDRVAVAGETRHVRAPEIFRHSCPACGSPVFLRRPGGEETILYMGSLDAPEDLAPTYELWTARRPRWLPRIPGLRLFEQDRKPASPA